MFARIFAKFFWDAYDYVGRLILGNVVFFFLILGMTGAFTALFYPIYLYFGRSPVIFGLGTGAAILFALPFPAAGMIYFLSRISEEKEPELRDFIRGLRIHYTRLVKLTLAFVLFFEILAANILFYINPDIIPPQWKLVCAVISGLCVWIFLYLSAMMLFAYPLAVHQRVGIRKVLYRSFLLVIDNPGIVALTLMLLFIIWGVGVLTRGVTIFILNLALSASLCNSLYVNVMEKYERMALEKESREEEDTKPSSWKEIKTRDFIEDRHDRYKRTLKDILKPWEY